MTVIPKKFGPPRHPSEIRISPKILELSVSAPDEVFQKLRTSSRGLTEAEAERRLQEVGPNRVAPDKRHSRLRLLVQALVNPLVVLLSVLAVISALTGDFRAAVVMAVMVVPGVVLRFVQEARAARNAASAPPGFPINS